MLVLMNVIFFNWNIKIEKYFVCISKNSSTEWIFEHFYNLFNWIIFREYILLIKFNLRRDRNLTRISLMHKITVDWLNRAHHRGITQYICKEAKYFTTRAVWIDNAYCEGDLCNSIAHLVKHTPLLITY